MAESIWEHMEETSLCIYRILSSRSLQRNTPAARLLKDLLYDVMQVCVSTSAADYIVNKPKGTYKKMYCYLSEQADLAVEVRDDPVLVPGPLVYSFWASNSSMITQLICSAAIA